jgi:hypothetical protein
VRLVTDSPSKWSGIPEGMSGRLGGCSFHVETRPDQQGFMQIRWQCGCGVFGAWWDHGFANDMYTFWREHAVKKLKKQRAEMDKKKRIDKARAKFRRFDEV